MTEAGHHVTGVEISDRADFSEQFVEQLGRASRIVKDDFYTVQLDGRFDVVCYWNGFGIGSDNDQRALLRRVAAEWLTEGGTALFDISNPFVWARWDGDQEHKPERPEDGYDYDLYELTQLRPDTQPVRRYLVDHKQSRREVDANDPLLHTRGPATPTRGHRSDTRRGSGVGRRSSISMNPSSGLVRSSARPTSTSQSSPTDSRRFRTDVASRAMTEPLISMFEDVWGDIVWLCDGLTDEQWALPTDCPGWTVQDHVAHMIGTERMLLGEQPDGAAASRMRRTCATTSARPTSSGSRATADLRGHRSARRVPRGHAAPARGVARA